MPRAIVYVIITRTETKILNGENEMGSPRFEGIHAQLDCKLSYGNKNQTQLTLVYNIVLKSKSEQNRNYEKYSQTGITVKIHINHAVSERLRSCGSLCKKCVVFLLTLLSCSSRFTLAYYSTDHS